MARKKGDTGKRYSEDKKNEIVAFARDHGRGGLTEASRKYGVSMVSLSRWLKKGPKRRGRKPGAKAKSAASALGKVASRRVSKALSSIKVLEKEFRKVRKTLQALGHR